MRFLEYLTEESNKDLYVLVNTKSKIAPNHNGDEFKTWAKSPEKAFHQILFQIREAPDRYSWAILNNRDEYSVIPWEQYKKMQEQKPLPEPPPVQMRQDPQGNLFNEPWQPPN